MLKPFEEGYCLTNKIHCAKHDRSAQFQNFQFQITEHRTENIDFLLNAKKKKQKKKNGRVHKNCFDKYFKLKL